MKYICWTVVLILHILILCFFLSDWGKEPEQPGELQEQLPQAQEPAELPSGGMPPVDSSAGGAETAPAGVTLPPAPVAPPTSLQARNLPGPYSASYYTRAADLTPPREVHQNLKNCRVAVVIDVDKHRVLWGHNEQSIQPIASLTKMMTVMLLMEDLQTAPDRLSLDTPVRVTKNAAAIGGHQVWLDPREVFTIQDLLKCILIRSANDCAFLVAEYLGGGDVEKFVARMNRRGKEIGCQNFVFYNPHGLPVSKGGKENQGNALELAYLAERLWQYPEVIRWTQTKLEYIRENTSKPFQLATTNKLLSTCSGVCGMKTGMTDKAGFCLVATCERNGHRVISVVMGGDNATHRDQLSKALIEWAYTLQ